MSERFRPHDATGVLIDAEAGTGILALYLDSVNTLPANNALGYAPGCLAIDTVSAKLFRNIGTLAACQFVGDHDHASVDTITALAGGGQGGAGALTGEFNRVTTVATIGDSVTLPASYAGAWVVVENAAAANAMDIFPATGDAINALAANTAIRIKNNYVVIFFCTTAGTWMSSPLIPPVASFTTGALASTTFAVGNLTGSQDVHYTNTQATPGTLTTRTATQMFNDSANVQPGDSYFLRITNGQGTGVLTVGAGAGVTLTGTMTIAINTFRDFIVTFNSATTMTFQTTGTGTFS